MEKEKEVSDEILSFTKSTTDIDMNKVKYEEVLELVGGFGRYQFFFYIWLTLSFFADCGALAYMVFAGIFPTKVPCRSSNGSDFDLESSTTSTPSINVTTDCFNYSFHSVVQEWDLTGPKRHIASTITSMQMAGMFFVPIIFGQFSDRYGRKPVTMVSIVGLAGTGALCAYSNSWKQFAAARFFHGFFLGGGFASKYVLFAETIVQRWRLVNYFLGPMLGYLWLAFLGGVVTNSWRALQLLYLVPCLITFPLCIYPIVESPKFDLEKGKPEAALKGLTRILVWNRARLPNSKLASIVEKYQYSKKKYHIWDLFYDRRASIRTLVLCYSWMSASCVYYGLLFNLNNVPGSVVLNFTYIMLMRLFFNSGIVLIDRYSSRLGRRLLHQVGLFTVGISMLVMAIFLALPQLKSAFPFLARSPALIGAGFCGFIWCAVDVYSAELFPTAVRGIGYGLGSTCARIGSVIAPQICLLSFHYVSAPYIVFLGVLVINVVLAFLFLPETKGKELPDFNNIDEEKVIEAKAMELQKL